MEEEEEDEEEEEEDEEECARCDAVLNLKIINVAPKRRSGAAADDLIGMIWRVFVKIIVL